MASADAERKEAYAGHIEMAQGFFSGGGSTDPMDIPRAIAAIIAMPPGKRPLRKPVHPNTQATDALNAAHTQVQAAVLGQGRYKAWHDGVVD
jgi:methyl coenzyme M reductase subunit C